MTVHKLLQHNVIITISAIIIGYSLWYAIAQHVPQQVTRTVPIYFYYNNKQRTITGPESACIKIKGSRTALYHYTTDSDSMHIDLSHRKPGTYNIPLSRKDLFLPDSIHLVHLQPTHITVTIT